jgi:hypothetical protein
MSSLFVDISSESGSFRAQVPLSPIEDWWQSLLKRNNRVRAAEEAQDRPSIPDLCPYCESDPVHFTVVDIGGSHRVCRKCGTVLGYLR